MNCQDFSSRIHSLLDGELPVFEREETERHLRRCEHCRKASEELALVKQLVAVPVSVPGTLQRQMWKSLRAGMGRNLVQVAAGWIDVLRTRLRDLDQRVVVSKLVAVPLTMACFTMLALQLPHFPPAQWTYSAFAMTSEQPAEPPLSNGPVTVQAIQRRAETNDFMDTVWRIPYEDSLSLVAEIQPGGHARIDDVLEYPRNPGLLDAIDLSLRNSQFEQAAAGQGPFLIYSFQKVDVYEGRNGGDSLDNGSTE